MKKNISINISGIIFHIEEDAYERLRDYLDSINKYFSTFDDSMEIIADIESRIAELFLAKLNENKQIINKEDVEELITTMGSIKDFQAVEDQTTDSSQDESTHDEKEDYSWKDTSSRKLYRDEKRKLLGGVCAGVAHYFNIDPLWVRLIFLILFLGSYGTLFLIYIIMWIVIPANYELSEDKKLKKMYRNPDGKVLGGVASGIATYFGVDVAVVRLIFVISIFLGGTGLIAYIILWLILPEAKTITDRVQMQGEPITLSNIESNIKKSFKVKDDEDENIFVKILLFPFRLIALIITGLGKALGPILLFLVDFIRIAAGAFMVFAGVVMIFSIVVVLGALLGIISTASWNPTILTMGDIGFPLEVMADTFPVITVVAAFFGILIPCVVFILLGISLIAKRIIFNATVGWSLFAVFVLSVITLSANVPAIVYKFREDGEYRVTETYDLGNKMAFLTLHEVGLEDYNVTRLRLRGYEGPEYKLEKVFESQGSSRKNAIENAQMIDYNVTLEDSVFVFDSNIKFKDHAVFRAQRLELTLFIPYNKPFKMSEDLEYIIYNTIHRAGYDVWDMPDNTWMFTEEGLKCITCDESDEKGTASIGDFDQDYDFRNFQAIEISSAFIVDIEQGDQYKVLAKGDQRDLRDVKIYQNGDKLYIAYEDENLLKRLKDREYLKFKIIVPSLNELELSGASKVYLYGFDQERMHFDLGGAAFAKAQVNVDDLEIDLSGASEMELTGSGREMNVDISGASHLNAYDYEVKTAKVEAHGASSAKVYVTEELDIEETLASSVKYRGDATVRRERDGL